MNQTGLDRERILEMACGFMSGCVLGAAAELDLFTLLGDDSMTADQIADGLGADLRATAMLLDVVASLAREEEA